MSSLSCMALCIMINFFVLWYICLSFLLIHLRMVESILQGELPCLFITLKRFLLQNMVSRSFLVVLGNSVVFGFLFCFAFFFFCLMVRFQYSQVLVIFFSPSFLMLSWFVISIPSIVSFPLLHYQHGTFLIPNSIPISWLCILIVCVSVYISFSFLTNIFISSMYIRVLFLELTMYALIKAILEIFTEHSIYVSLSIYMCVSLYISDNYICEKPTVTKCQWLYTYAILTNIYICFNNEIRYFFIHRYIQLYSL